MADSAPVIAALALVLSSLATYLNAQAKRAASVALAKVKAHDREIKEAKAHVARCDKALARLTKKGAR